MRVPSIVIDRASPYLRITHDGRSGMYRLDRSGPTLEHKGGADVIAPLAAATRDRVVLAAEALKSTPGATRMVVAATERARR